MDKTKWLRNADSLAGIIWGETAPNKMNWHEANDWITELNTSKYLGYSDWRLPERWELVKAYDGKVDGFKTDVYYWSSTSGVDLTGYAWNVNFLYGNVDSVYKTSSFYVRPVRGGQCGNLKIKKSDIKREAVKLLKGMIGRLK